MLIPITAEDGAVQEWALVELQGRIEPQHDIDLQESLVVGTLQLSKTNQDVVQLQIGYHVLEGKKLPLKKPMVVLESHRSHNEGHSSNESAGSTDMVCKVIGVLRHKYLFKTRPKALISKPSGRHT